MKSIVEFIRDGTRPIGVERYAPQKTTSNIPSTQGPGYKPKNVS
jgi:hypothetical protein